MAHPKPAPPRPDGGTVAAALVRGRAALSRRRVPSAWLDAEVLLAHVLHTSRESLLAHPERELTRPQRTRLEKSLRSRATHVPVAYLTGEREFYGLPIRVTPAVLIPRPETELLVELAISWLQSHPSADRVIDLGTGSGAVAIALASAARDVRIVASDVDARAVRVAQANVRARRLASRITVVRRDLLQGARKADLVVANLPYLSAARRRAWQKEIEFEPRRALDGGEDGLLVIRRALAQAPDVIDRGGAMLLECDPSQPRRITRLANQEWPGAVITVHKDLTGRDRVVAIQL